MVEAVCAQGASGRTAIVRGLAVALLMQSCCSLAKGTSIIFMINLVLPVA